MWEEKCRQQRHSATWLRWVGLRGCGPVDCFSNMEVTEMPECTACEERTAVLLTLALKLGLHTRNAVPRKPDIWKLLSRMSYASLEFPPSFLKMKWLKSETSIMLSKILQYPLLCTHFWFLKWFWWDWSLRRFFSFTFLRIWMLKSN